MVELFTIVPPSMALNRLLSHLPTSLQFEKISTTDALDRVLAEPLVSPAALPSFPRSTVDGYAVRAADTFGATESLPAYLAVIGEAPMGRAPDLTVSSRPWCIPAACYHPALTPW
jgi:molybdopterin molybdotransferase